MRYLPYLLQADTPDEGTDIAQMLRAKYGADPKALFARVEAAARETGLELEMSKQPRMYSTVKAHCLLRALKDSPSQSDLAFRLFEANFVEGLDISADDVLVELCVPFGLEESDARQVLASAEARAQIRRAANDASGRGIRGVPFYIFNGTLAVSGAQSVEVFTRAIAQSLNN